LINRAIISIIKIKKGGDMRLMDRPQVRAFSTSKWVFLILAILLFLFEFAGIQSKDIRLGLWKFMLGFGGGCSGYILGKLLFPNISISSLREEIGYGNSATGRAILFCGACFLRGILIASFIVGVLLGV
jgi:hypothetical protein